MSAPPPPPPPPQPITKQEEQPPEFEDVELAPCPECGRNFATARLEKHIGICKNKGKTNPAAKRKVFDSSSKRGLTDVLEARRQTCDDTSAVGGNVAPFSSPLLPEFIPDKSPTGYVGLSNQGATCYMNSALQSLYMTPEFRSALFHWHHDPTVDDVPDMCIPYQLQMLFSYLQHSERRAIDTHPLTKSFGWTSAESFQQHDVQELLRVLFEALAFSFASTSQCDLIRQLYQGELLDYVQCKECNTMRSREDQYLDIQLGVRGVTSVEEALQNFITPDILDGDNQYNCEHCGKKTDAAKGLQFKSLPNILTLHLKRFDFDYQVMRRIKLNHEVRFPFTLDMRPFMPEAHVVDGEVYTYDLYSVLIHSGSAMGGHYHVMIKEYPQGQWYDFNDSCVSSIYKSDVEKQFGTPVDKPGAGVMGASNAYMLLYRRTGPNESLEGVSTVPKVPVPALMLEIVNKDNDVHKKAKEESDKRRDDLTIRVFHEKESRIIVVNKYQLLSAFIPQAMAVMQLCAPPDDSESTLPPLDYKLVRLRRYNPHNATLSTPFYVYPSQEGHFENDQSLVDANLGNFANVFIERRESEDVAWPEYNPDHICVHALRFDRTKDVQEEQSNAITINISRHEKLATLRGRILEQCGCDGGTNQVVLVAVDAFGTNVLGSDSDDRELFPALEIMDGHTVHFEVVSGESVGVDAHTALEAYLTEQLNFISLRHNMPGSRMSEHTVRIDQRCDLRKLKEIMSEKTSVPVDELIVRKGATPNGKELKDLAASLERLGLMDGMTVFVEVGVPLASNECTFVFYLFTPSPVDTLAATVAAGFVEQASSSSGPPPPPPLPPPLPSSSATLYDTAPNASLSDVELVNVAESSGGALLVFGSDSDAPKRGPPKKFAQRQAKTEANSSKTTLECSKDGSDESKAPTTTTSASGGTQDGTFTQLFRAPLVETTTVADTKDLIFQNIKKLPEYSHVTSPARIRLRRRVGGKVGRILMDHSALKENTGVTSDSVDLAFQILDEDEALVEGDIILTTQQFFPSTATVGKKAELRLRKELTCAQMADRLAELHGIGVGHARFVKPWSFQMRSLQDVYALDWEEGINYESTVGTLLRDGDFILFRNMAEDNGGMAAATKKAKASGVPLSSVYARKEQGLKIRHGNAATAAAEQQLQQQQEAEKAQEA